MIPGGYKTHCTHTLKHTIKHRNHAQLSDALTHGTAESIRVDSKRVPVLPSVANVEVEHLVLEVDPVHGGALRKVVKAHNIAALLKLAQHQRQLRLNPTAIVSVTRAVA